MPFARRALLALHTEMPEARLLLGMEEPPACAAFSRCLLLACPVGVLLGAWHWGDFRIKEIGSIVCTLSEWERVAC